MKRQTSLNNKMFRHLFIINIKKIEIKNSDKKKKVNFREWGILFLAISFVWHKATQKQNQCKVQSNKKKFAGGPY